MNNNTPYALLISIAALLMVGVSYFFGGGASDTQVLAQLNAVKAQLAQSQHAGALSGPEISSPYLQWGNVTTWHYMQAMTQGTSTICSFQSPAASSTIVQADAHFTAALGYTATWLWGTDRTNPTATTTALGTALAVTSPDPTGTILATTSATTIIAPNTRINFNLSTTSAAQTGLTVSNFAPVGVCEARLIQVD